MTSKYFPAWFLGKYPGKRVILASYEATFAESWGRKARDIFTESARDVFGPDRILTKDAGSWWETSKGGAMMTTGVCGPATGKGANCFLIDDPLKNEKEAESKTYREHLWNWYRATARTRLEPGGSMVLIMTRWHEDDLAGRLIAESEAETGEKWEVISLPALAEEDDPLGRSEGEALWPARFPVEDLNAVKITQGPYYWNALYQQRPSPLAGGIFHREWFKPYLTLPGRFDEIIHSWDMSFKDFDTSDYVAGQVWGRRGGNFYLLHQVHDRMDFIAAKEAVRQVYYDKRFRRPHRILIEDTANGPAIIRSLKDEVPILLPVNPKGSKIARAYACTGPFEAGNVFVPDPRVAPWIGDYIDEMAAFPNGAHDDQVDATSQALNDFLDRMAESQEFQVLSIRRREMTMKTRGY